MQGKVYKGSVRKMSIPPLAPLLHADRQPRSAKASISSACVTSKISTKYINWIPRSFKRYCVFHA